jgi:PAS domain S-box-containing protein
LDKLISVNAVLAGFFAFAAIHYAVHWWFSRYERVFLVFSIQCALYTTFCLARMAFERATTIPDIQTALGRVMTLGPVIHIVLLQFFVCVSGRRDRAFRLLVTTAFVVLGVLNHWVPLRGTVFALQSISLPGGGVSLLPLRTPPGLPLGLYYLASYAAEGYGFLVARTLWRRDRSGAILIAVSASAIMLGTSVAILVDFAKLPMPYLGALPHTLFVICMALFFSREYSARGARAGATERQFEAAFEHSPVGKALVATDGRFLRVNRAFCDILGSTAEEIGAHRLYDILGDDDEIETESGRLLTGEVLAHTVERRLVRKGGDPVWARLVVSIVPDDQGKPVQMIAHVQDVTELRAHRERLEELVATRTRELSAAKDEAERANRAKSQFLAHISHEIRNPLHIMLLYAQILERDPTLGGAQQAQVGLVRSSGNKLLALMNDLLEMAKIEARRPELVEDRFDPWATLDEVEQMFAGEAASKGVELTIACAPELPHALLGDAGKVTQILINLAGNALKFTQRGAIRFKASASALAGGADGPDGRMVVKIAVADTGIGIAANDAARIFQPFEQLEAGKRAGGTGLGLAISLGHARLMGGDLTVESAPGIGSTFTFTFVAKSVGGAASRAARGPIVQVAAGVTRVKVLIVDDLAVNREALSELLSGPRFETRTAGDGPGALSIHADWRPDLMLIDLRMPGMNGLEAIRRLRAAGSKAAIGALSASALADDERQALALGADFFLGKPFDDRELMERIARILGTVPGAGELSLGAART